MSCLCNGGFSSSRSVSSSSTGRLPATSTGALVCGLLPVKEFSTSIQRFQNQIFNEVIAALNRSCVLNIPARTILAEVTETIATTISVPFTIEAISVASTSITIQNVVFQIIGFSSVIVQVSFDIVATITFTDINGIPQTQQVVTPVTTVITVPGDFPANVVAEGDVVVGNITVIQDIDPSTLAITGETIVVTVIITVRIVTTA